MRLEFRAGWLLAFCLAVLPYAWAADQDQDKVSKRDGMPQVLIPAGEFVMGADAADAFGRTAEFPPHRVAMAAYWIDQHEVTNAQFAAFLNAVAAGKKETIYAYCDLGNPFCRLTYDAATGRCGVRKGFEDHPVCAVSWVGANAYSRHVRRRLPTEAEWEKAARGTDQRRYPWGNDWNAQSANSREAGRRGPVSVGSTRGDRSPFGVWDMAGNVREWVQDIWDEGFYLASPAANPVNDKGLGYHVVRGGAWCLTEWDARTTSRQSHSAGVQRRYLGFRCAESVPEPLPPAVPVSAEVLFYAPLDGTVSAAAARGERRAVEQSGAIAFVPGRRGQAALLGEDPQRRYWVAYETENNLRLEEGALALWIQPRGWKGTDRGFHYFFMVMDAACCKFYLYRFQEKNLLVLAGNGVEGEWGALSLPTQDWQDGQWVHLAVTWIGREVALYVNGKAAGRTVVPPEKWIRSLPATFSLGQICNWAPSDPKTQTAFAEFVIFSRALTPEQVVAEMNRQGPP